MIELNVTATIRIRPWKNVPQKDVRFNANTKIGISRNAIAPIIELAAEPLPPKMLVPPMTPAATEARMNWSPAIGEPDCVCAVTQIDASAARNPQAAYASIFL